MSNNEETDGKSSKKYVYDNNGPVNQIEKLYGNLKNVTYNTQHKEVQKAVSIRFGFNDPDLKFTGRSEELNVLKAATVDNKLEPGRKPPIVVISGLGGIGKTQLVRKFIKENRSHYKNIIWINSEVYSTMMGEFTELATTYLKISTKSNKKDKDIQPLIGEVFYKLSSPTLIAFDNIDDDTKDTQFLKAILTTGTSDTRPHIVITSRLQEWGNDIHRIRLQEFIKEDALQYLLDHLTDSSNFHNDSDNDKIKLVEKLQYFPLALAQATAHINNHRVSQSFYISQYLREFDISQQGREKLDSKLFQNVTGLYEKTTLTTWEVTIAAINKCGAIGEIALRILRIMAYFDPDNIRRDIFFNLNSSLSEQNTGVQADVISAVRLLTKYSMVYDHEKTMQSMLSIHRLVQYVTKLELENDSNLKTTILRDGLHLISAMQQDKKFKECLEHGISIFLAAITCNKVVQEYKTFPAIVIANLNGCGKFIRAINFGDEILKQLMSILGENDSDTLDCMFETAVSYYYLGKYSDALQMFNEIYEKRMTISGDDDPLTLKLKSNIANIYVMLGKHSEALLMREQILKKRKKILGEDHQDTLNIMYNISVSYSRLGKYTEALQMSQEVFEKLKIKPGPNDSITLKAESNTGCIFCNLGKYSDGLRIAKDVFEKRKTSLGEYHPETLNSMSHAAFAHNGLGEYSEALRLYQVVFEKRKENLLEDHPKTLDSKTNIAITYNNLGKYYDALQIHEAVFNKLKTILGEDHLSSVHSKSNIAESYCNLGKYSEALEIQQDVFGKQKTILGEDHLVTIDSFSNSGVSHSYLGDHSAAMKIHQDVSNKLKIILGGEHPDTLTIKFNIAVSYSNMGEHSAAAQLFQEVFDKRKIIFGEDHLHTLDSKFRIAILQNNMGNHSMALQIHQEVYDIRQTMLGKDHPDSLNSMSNIAYSYSNMGEIDKAFEIEQVVFEKRKTVLGENHPKTLASMSNIAALYSYLGKYSKALRMFQDVHERRQISVGKHHPDTLQSALLIDLCGKDMTASHSCNIL